MQTAAIVVHRMETRSRTANERGKATRSSALEEIPAAGSASTRGRRVHKMKTVKPRTNRKNVLTGEYSAEMRLISEPWCGLSPGISQLPVIYKKAKGLSTLH